MFYQFSNASKLLSFFPTLPIFVQIPSIEMHLSLLTCLAVSRVFRAAAGMAYTYLFILDLSIFVLFFRERACVSYLILLSCKQQCNKLKGASGAGFLE